MRNSIGNNIAKYRKQAGMTQAELAEKINVSVQAISKWENDISHPDVERIGELALALNTSAESIINGESSVLTTTLKSNVDFSKRLILITVNVTSIKRTDITLRIPMELFVKAKEDGTLNTVIGDSMKDIPESVFEMIMSGVVGPIVNIKRDEVCIAIEVIEYDC